MKASHKLFFLCFLVLPLFSPTLAWGGPIERASTRVLASDPVHGYTEISDDGGATWTLLKPGGTTQYDLSTIVDLDFKITSNPLLGRALKIEIHFGE